MTMKLQDLLVVLATEEYDSKLQNIVNGLRLFAKRVSQVSEIFKNLFEEAAPKLQELILSLQVPGYTKEEKEELVKAVIAWGNYGWTYCSSTPHSELLIFPEPLECADDYMAKYCSDEEIISIKNHLSGKGFDEKDLEEALFCCQHDKFKSSCLILFGLIDHLLIKRNKTFTKNNKTMRKLGKSAVAAIEYDSQKDFEKDTLFSYLTFLNIIKCLGTLFEYGDDFQTQPVIINRNFISHGMYESEVTKLDCFKVWSALFSFATVFPAIEDLVYHGSNV